MSTPQDDGVIKYQGHRKDGVIYPTEQLDRLNHARTLLFDLGLIGTYPNGVGYGNVSVRTVENQFLITGSATGGTRELCAAHYCLVESFSMANNSVLSFGALDASSESMTHGAIYAAAEEVQCVMHVHSRQLFDVLLEQNVPSTSAEIAYGTPDMAQAVTRLVMGQTQFPTLFVMAGHDEGLVAYGVDIESVLNLLIDSFKREIPHDENRHHWRQRT
jgi:hypothetical protein